MNRRTLLKTGLALMAGLITRFFDFRLSYAKEIDKMFEITKTDAEWRSILPPEAYTVLRKEGTEPSFQNKYHDNKAPGVYHCAGCDLPLFSSKEKVTVLLQLLFLLMM